MAGRPSNPRTPGALERKSRRMRIEEPPHRAFDVRLCQGRGTPDEARLRRGDSALGVSREVLEEVGRLVEGVRIVEDDEVTVVSR